MAATLMALKTSLNWQNRVQASCQEAVSLICAVSSAQAASRECACCRTRSISSGSRSFWGARLLGAGSGRGAAGGAACLPGPGGGAPAGRGGGGGVLSCQTAGGGMPSCSVPAWSRSVPSREATRQGRGGSRWRQSQPTVRGRLQQGGGQRGGVHRAPWAGDAPVQGTLAARRPRSGRRQAAVKADAAVAGPPSPAGRQHSGPESAAKVYLPARQPRPRSQVHDDECALVLYADPTTLRSAGSGGHRQRDGPRERHGRLACSNSNSWLVDTWCSGKTVAGPAACRCAVRGTGATGGASRCRPPGRADDPSGS